MNLPKSAADLPDKKQDVSNGTEIMIVIENQKFMLNLADALTLAGCITAQVAGKLRYGG